jgi:hypothetical protein
MIRFQWINSVVQVMIHGYMIPLLVIGPIGYQMMHYEPFDSVVFIPLVHVLLSSSRSFVLLL